MQCEFNTLLYKHPLESRFKSSRNELSMLDYLVSIEKIYQTRLRIYFCGERLISLNFLRHIPVTRVITPRSDISKTSIRLLLVSKVWHMNLHVELSSSHKSCVLLRLTCILSISRRRNLLKFSTYRSNNIKNSLGK